jgi:hypothetical protein
MCPALVNSTIKIFQPEKMKSPSSPGIQLQVMSLVEPHEGTLGSLEETFLCHQGKKS